MNLVPIDHAMPSLLHPPVLTPLGEVNRLPAIASASFIQRKRRPTVSSLDDDPPSKGPETPDERPSQPLPPPSSPPSPTPPDRPESPQINPDRDPDLPDKPGPPLSDPENPHGR